MAGMSNLPIDGWEHRLQQLAAELPYPPTPDIARQVVQRTSQERGTAGSQSLPGCLGSPGFNRPALGWHVAAAPPVRAGFGIFQLAAVRIFLVELTPTATHLPTRGNHPSGSFTRCGNPPASTNPDRPGLVAGPGRGNHLQPGG